MIYFDNAASTPCLDCVMDAMDDANREWSNVHRSFHRYAEGTTKRFEEARGQVADFIGAEPDEIVFTSGTTDSLNMVANGLIKRGDHVLVTRMDHHSNIIPWQATGACVEMVPLCRDGLDWCCLESMLKKRPRVFAFPAVSNVLGTVLPVDKLVRMAHTHGVTTVVDAAQSVPHTRTNVKESGADFLAFSGHKMHGPTGIGVLYGRKPCINSLKPFRYGSGMVTNVGDGVYNLREDFRRLEAGTPPIQQAIGLGRACQYWSEYGMDRVQRHISSLTFYAYRKLRALPGVNVLGLSRTHGRIGIISFTVDGIHAHDIAALLGERNIAIRGGHHCAIPLHKSLGIQSSARISFAPHNDVDEIDFFIKALTDIQNYFATA